MDILRGDCITNWIYLDGDQSNAPLLLISGLGGEAEFWAPVRKTLSEKNFVASYDQPGCGGRPSGREEVSIQSLARDAASVLTSAFGNRPVTVVGHSTGGVIAQELAATQPHLVSRLVLSGTWHQANEYMKALFHYRKSITLRTPDLAAGLTELLSKAPDDVNTSTLAPQPLNASKVESTVRRIDALLAFDGASRLSKISAKTLIIGARDDRIVPATLQEALHASMAGSSLHMLPYGGHFFPKKIPNQFLKSVDGWLSKVGDQ